MDDDPEPCARCGGTNQVVWSPAFAEWLCATCRWTRTDQLFKEPVTPLPVPP